MKIQKKLFDWTIRLEQSPIVKTIRGGLIMMIPILMIGAFCLVGKSFPLPAYLTWIKRFGDGILYRVFDIIYQGTFGMLSVYMTAAIAFSFQREHRQTIHIYFGGIATALTCFLVLSGIFSKNFMISSFGPTGMITAILSGYLGSACFFFFYERKRLRRTYSAGEDVLFSKAVGIIFPAAATVLIFTLLSFTLSELFAVDTVYALITKGATHIFSNIGTDFGSGLLFVFVSSVLWFFGIHGSDCLQGVMDALYADKVQVNINAVALGGAPTEILCKQFFDCFILLGGCGSAFALLIALLVFSRRESNRRLGLLSAFPMIFNINETMIFGLPVILNPILLIPFLLTPICCYMTSYFAIYTGMVEKVIAQPEWTTPIFMGGYIATGSLSGSLLQLVNLSIGILIYAPFVKMLDAHKEWTARESYEGLVKFYQQYEETGSLPVQLTELNSTSGDLAKQLALDISRSIQNDHQVHKMFYQPQYNAHGRCIGAEALMRFQHPRLGTIYPPLVIQLAKEAGCLLELEEKCFSIVLKEMPVLEEKLGKGTKISINVTGDSFSNPAYLTFLQKTMKQNTSEKMQAQQTHHYHLCLEVTEQTALKFNEQTANMFEAVKQLEIQLAIDDFSMGQTSLNYLKENHFQLIKLDGSLVRGMLDNERCLEIIASITSLAEHLGLDVLAEYVETKEQKDALEKVGCRLYQGYLYSPAVSVEALNGERKKDLMPV